MATQVEILMRTEGGPAAATAAGGSPDKAGEEAEKGADQRSKTETNALSDLSKNFSNKLGNAKKFFSKNLGLQFGLSSVLKQSQVFTSFVGTIFQLIGALVDVILAPLLPLFFPLVRMLASAIPHAQKVGEYIAAELITFFQGVKDWYNAFGAPFLNEKWEEFKTAWAGGWKDVAKLIWDWTWTGIKWAWVKLFTVAIPWLWDKIKGFGSWAWEKFKEFGAQAKQRIITFGLYLWHTVYTKFNTWVKWFKNLTPEAKALLKKQVLKFIGYIVKAPFKIFSLGLKLAGFMIKMILPGIGHVLVGIVKVGGVIVKGIMKAAFGIVKFIFKWIFKGVKLLVGKVAGAAKGLIGTLLKKITTSLSGMKFFGGAFKKLGESMKFLKIAAKASKAIPVLGAVATLGFGVAETISNTKKYGWKAGLATATKTVAATALAGAGQTYASLAVDMGGSLAISQLAKRGVFGKEGSHFQPGGAGYVDPKAATNVTINITSDGQLPQTVAVQQLNKENSYESNISAEMNAAEGAPT